MREILKQMTIKGNGAVRTTMSVFGFIPFRININTTVARFVTSNIQV